MKSVSIIKHTTALSTTDADKLRERLKGQFAEGLVLLDARLDYLGTVVLPEPSAAVKLIPAPSETGSESPFTLVRRSRSAASLAEIKAAIASGCGPEVIRPFDELEFKLDTGETVTAVCGGYISPTRARFVFKDVLGDAPMNDDATNAGGYYKSKGRRHVLEEIYPHLPPELREVIEPRPLVETIDGERVEYADPLWIPSGTDVFGPREGWYEEEPDSVQLEIFKTERGRVKERNGETVSWWLRSPLRSYSTSFVGVYTGGAVNIAYAYSSLAFAPGFDL